MGYDLIWHEDSVKDLKTINRKSARLIIDKVKTLLISDPIKSGTPLKGGLKGFRRFRVGAYRVIYTIDHSENKVIILKINHRKSVYKH